MGAPPDRWLGTKTIGWSPFDVKADHLFDFMSNTFWEWQVKSVLRRDQYAILWVKHRHAGRTELHFLVPRVELSTGKSLNIAPPGWEALFNPFRETYNALLGWASPDDPAHARDVSLP